MKSIHKKYFTTIGLIWSACLIVFFFVYMLVLVPQSQAEKDVARRLAEQKDAYHAGLEAAKEETQARLRGQVSDLRDRLKDFVIDFGDSANLTFDISRTANSQEIGSFSIKSRDTRESSNTADSGSIRAQHLDVSFTAGFHQFAAFVNALERHRPVLLVDTFAITRSEQLEADAQGPLRGHQAKLNLAVLVKNQPGN
jgi:Tfp pilus assembly protein PilO